MKLTKLRFWSSALSLVSLICFCQLTFVSVAYRSTPRKQASPSLRAPLVVAVCESHPRGFARYHSIEDAADAADSDAGAVIELVSSWERQLEQMATMLKTLLYFSQAPVWRIAVLTDTEATFQQVLNLTSAFPENQRVRLHLEHHEQWYPATNRNIAANWRPCAWAKQFLAEALPLEEAVVYVDTDLVFLGPAEDMWDLFEDMNSQQMVALAPEPKYALEPKRKHAGHTGLNTGVMLANLTRQRFLLGGSLGSALVDAGFLSLEYRHDQDALNQFLSDKPHFVKEVSARWNFVISSCHPLAPPCPECKKQGVLVLHGADVVFYRLVEGIFLVMYGVLSQLSLNDPPHTVLARLRSQMTLLDSLEVKDTACANFTSLAQSLTLGLTQLVSSNRHFGPTSSKNH